MFVIVSKYTDYSPYCAISTTGPHGQTGRLYVCAVHPLGKDLLIFPACSLYRLLIVHGRIYLFCLPLRHKFTVIKDHILLRIRMIPILYHNDCTLLCPQHNMIHRPFSLSPTTSSQNPFVCFMVSRVDCMKKANL